MLTPRNTIAGSVRTGTLGGQLRPRVIGLAEALTGPSWLALLISSGGARISNEDDVLHGPTLAWRPWNSQSRATAQAGTEGAFVILGNTALASAVGHMPITRDLRAMASRSVTAPLADHPDTFQTLSVAFAGLGRELRSDHPTAHAVVESYLRIILVEAYRAALTQASAGDVASPSHKIFAEFGTLVEAHFRDRWSVNDYAQALGLSRDRLGDICRRTRGFGPKQVIDRRVALEARLQLENSPNSIQQVAALTGFSTTAQFNRFFNRMVGTPPGAYRRAFLGGDSSGFSDPGTNYDWP